jgi:hypothetical protein
MGHRGQCRPRISMARLTGGAHPAPPVRRPITPHIHHHTPTLVTSLLVLPSYRFKERSNAPGGKSSYCHVPSSAAHFSADGKVFSQIHCFG